MTRKHFQKLADYLILTQPDERGPLYDQWLGDVIAVANVCEWANDNFDRKRFFSACGHEAPIFPSHVTRIV